jgi:hypothetical protein
MRRRSADRRSPALPARVRLADAQRRSHRRGRGRVRARVRADRRSSTPDPRAAARDHRTPGPAPGVFFCAAPIAARAARADRCAARDPGRRCSSSSRPSPPGSTGRAPRAVIRRRPMSPGAPAYRVKRPPSGIQKSRPGGRHPGPDGPKAWAMFQTNNTAVFPTGPNCPIIPLKVAYIFVRGPYDQTRRPVGRGA